MLNLKISYNRISSLDSIQLFDLINLKDFFCDFNRITSLPANAFANCGRLKTLRLGFNKIQKLDRDLLARCTSLYLVDFSHNEIDSIHGLFKNLRQLQKIYLNDNKIRFIDKKEDFYDYNDLEHVDLSGQEFEH